MTPRECADWTRGPKNGPAISMMRPAPQLSRRQLLAGLSGTAAAAIWRPGVAQPAPPTIAIRQDAAGKAEFDPAPPAAYRLGERLRLTVTNALAGRISLGVRGLDGAQAVEPLLKLPPIDADQSTAIDIALNQSGTFVFDARLLDDAAKSLPVAAFMVAEVAPPQVDHDRIFVIEELGGRYTVNGKTSIDLGVRGNERLRLRLVNGCRRSPVALQFDDHDMRVIAIDSRPAEPFLARDHRVVLAPGTRVDALVDATQAAGATSAIRLFAGSGPKRIGQIVYSGDTPARAQPLPAASPLADVPIKLDLASALRVPVDAAGDWSFAGDMIAKRPPPLFRAKQGRTVLLTLANRTKLPTTFHLHGHHVRWLDRLDDGWKPFLLDTVIVDAGQTERIAFRADFPGEWLIESVPMNAGEQSRFVWFGVNQK